jgi:tRNA nucleotidyltransferase (CCA-adding enzyme)
MAEAAGKAKAPASGWELLPHGADVCVQGWGPSPGAAFEQAALALTGIATHAEVRAVEAVEVACSAPDLEILLVDWLNAVIYEMAVRRMLFGRYRVAIEGTRLSATLWGEPVDRARHAPACEPKGATYTMLDVAEEGGRWTARCVVDV